ncbi:hypothetical protein [Vulcanisaeta distributa]|nr:hypothetical protein [Vulcanisaeta distributa]
MSKVGNNGIGIRINDKNSDLVSKYVMSGIGINEYVSISINDDALSTFHE